MNDTSISVALGSGGYLHWTPPPAVAQRLAAFPPGRRAAAWRSVAGRMEMFGSILTLIVQMGDFTPEMLDILDAKLREVADEGRLILETRRDIDGL